MIYIFSIEGYGITTDGQTEFINASTCNLRYKPIHPPIIFDVPIPEGHSKDELLSIQPQRLIRSKAQYPGQADLNSDDNNN